MRHPAGQQLIVTEGHKLPSACLVCAVPTCVGVLPDLLKTRVTMEMKALWQSNANRVLRHRYDGSGFSRLVRIDELIVPAERREKLRWPVAEFI